MISVMLPISHVIMLPCMAQSSIKTVHKIGFGNYFYTCIVHYIDALLNTS